MVHLHDVVGDVRSSYFISDLFGFFEPVLEFFVNVKVVL